MNTRHVGQTPVSFVVRGCPIDCDHISRYDIITSQAEETTHQANSNTTQQGECTGSKTIETNEWSMYCTLLTKTSIPVCNNIFIIEQDK